MTKTGTIDAAWWGVDLHTALDTGPGVTPMGGSHSATRGYYQSSWYFSSEMGIPFHLVEVFPVVEGITYNYYLNARAVNFTAAYLFYSSIVVLFIPSSL